MSGYESEPDDRYPELPEAATTYGGLLSKVLGKVPIPGAEVEVAGLSLTAESAEGRRRRIGTVLVRELPKEQPGD